MMKAGDYIKNYVYDGTINEYAKLAEVPLREAFDKLYRSRLYSQIRCGLSDMHCRSDDYLAEELHREQNEKHDNIIHPQSSCLSKLEFGD